MVLLPPRCAPGQPQLGLPFNPRLSWLRWTARFSGRVYTYAYARVRSWKDWSGAGGSISAMCRRARHSAPAYSEIGRGREEERSSKIVLV